MSLTGWLQEGVEPMLDLQMMPTALSLTQKQSQNKQTKNQLKVNAELFSQMAPKESQSHPCENAQI